ncbi:hypothetical protein DYB34_010707 [Aphanomyces astaci]|uniref:Origin recognition complex subunit 1 n=1 Tax=Aphanomyces astaci TaxID=112090 RepID=A0A418BNB0_APHAT|nr:hypothetical protein DYB34_010707 [Aphanomyces astaci]
MMALATLPPSLKRKLMQSTFTDTTTTSDKEVVVDTTAIDELAVACLVNVVDLAASYICTKLYAPLTGTLTSITTNNDAQTIGYVYSRRLKWLSPAAARRKRRRLLDPSCDENDLEGCKSRLEAACDQLQLSSIPDTLLGREEERRQIYQTLKLAVVDGESSPVYISGLPGMGKTATVKEILRTLERERDAQTIPPFTWIEVNGLHMPKPDQAYSMIWKALETFHFQAKSFNAKRARDCLDALFKLDNSSRPVLILVLDEMDFMLAGWDLPERLAPKLRSRFGINRIAFRSYTHDQIQRILHQRLASLNVFERGAIEIYAKALAHQSGDVRKALMVCKAATERALRRVTDTHVPSLVLSADIEVVQASMSQSPLVTRLRQCSTFECIFLVALLREIKLQTEGVVRRMANLTKTAGLPRVPSFADVRAICFELERSDIVRERKGKWALTFSHDEIQEAFLTHPVGRLLWT